MEQKKLKIIVKGHSKIEGHITYNLVVEFPDGSTYDLTRRYSELKSFHDLLRRETNSNSFPKFPPKKFFGYSNEEFINKRQQELNAFFDGICKDFSDLKSFKSFIETCKKDMKKQKKTIEPKEEKKVSNVLKKKMSEKTMIDALREKLKPEKRENKRLTQDEVKTLEDEFNSVVEELNKKYISINFEVELNPSHKKETKYEKLINEDKNLGNNEIKKNIEPGNDDNFNLVSEENEYFDNIEKEINQKMEAVVNKKKEMEKIYDINEILKIL